MIGRVGIRDVAREAGVSATTVSHALSGRGKVSPETRARVERIAQDLGYAPNRIASALRRRRTDVLGFVSDEIATTPFAGRIVLGAQDAAAAAGMTLMVVNSNRDAAVEQKQIEVLRAQQVDALLYATMFHREVVAPHPGGRPVVLVNAVDRQRSVSSIGPDEHRLGVDAARLLIGAGHRRIAHITIDEPGLGVDGRAAGYRDAMRSAGLPAHVVAVPGPADSAAGRVATSRAIAEDPALTAVFGFNDPMVMGAYQVAFGLGRAVPDDLSLVGVDNLELIAAQLLPGLTTFELPHYEMGRWAVEQAVRRLTTADLPEESVSVACAVVERGSVASRV